MNKKTERWEILMRIIITIVTGFILNLWKILITVLIFINLLITLFTNKRNKEIAEFCETWNTQLYIFLRYITFVSNERPFPFNKINKNISNFE
ncbi:DUF4389 domain-containing protein [Patescibacteria group bacterium]